MPSAVKRKPGGGNAGRPIPRVGQSRNYKLQILNAQFSIPAFSPCG